MAVLTPPVVLLRERLPTDGRVIEAFGIVKKRKRSIGRIEAAGGVQQEPCNAGGRILISRC